MFAGADAPSCRIKIRTASHVQMSLLMLSELVRDTDSLRLEVISKRVVVKALMQTLKDNRITSLSVPSELLCGCG